MRLWLQFSSTAYTGLSGGCSSFHHPGSGGRRTRRLRLKKKRKEKEIKVIFSYIVILSPVEDTRDPVSKENKKGSLPPS